MQNAMPAMLVPGGSPFGSVIPLDAVLGGIAKDMPVALIWFVGTDGIVFCAGKGVGLICGLCCW